MSWAADGRDRTDDRRIQFSETMCSLFRYVFVHVYAGPIVLEGLCHTTQPQRRRLLRAPFAPFCGDALRRRGFSSYRSRDILAKNGRPRRPRGARSRRVGRAACHASEARIIWASRAPSYQHGEPCHCCCEPGTMRRLCGMLGRTRATYPIERSDNWVCRASPRYAGRGIGACMHRAHRAIGGSWAGIATCHRTSAHAAWPGPQSQARTFGTSSARMAR